ncbi:MAG TPA: multidrug effflux MFS transporter [Gaiellaceae bacterium]|jgi:DHA1 family bicyclomycin/chloramphenicol resistance-like MFS transporter
MRISSRLVVVLGALSAFGPLSIDFYLPGLPRLATDFDTSASAGQLTLTACLLGLAVGQLVIGPLSDRFGRRPPLLVGLVAYLAASLACAAAPNIWVLVGLRLVQGLGGSAGIVVARSVVRDLASGVAAARLYSILMVVIGVVPILAPILGGAFLHVTSWRGLFVILAAVDAAIVVATARWLPETLSPERRQRAGSVAGFRELLGDRFFIAYAVVMGLAFASMFSYIAGSSFVLEDIHGVSPQTYGLLFGLNALGIVGASQLNRALVGRVSPQRMLLAGVTAQAVAGTVLLVIVLTDRLGLAGILPCLFVTVASMGLVMPNATALALTDYPHAAGSASALLGMLQFAFGALAAPLVGVAGRDTAVPMALLMAVFGIGALAVLKLASARLRTPASPEVAL